MIFQDKTVVSNRFRIDSSIGIGDQTEVYQCFDITQNRDCALKILPHKAKRGRIRRFKTEFQELHHLEHPYLIKAYDFAEEPAVGFLFTCELVDGTPITQSFDEFDPEIIVPLMIQVCQVFSFLHNRNIVHADIKASSILVVKNNDEKLTPAFDNYRKMLSAQSHEVQEDKRATSWNIKLTGLGLMESVPLFRDSGMRDSFYYIAPEVAMGRKYDFHADVYSLGVLFYQLVTSELPFHGETLLTLVKSRLRLDPLNPREINKNISSKLSQIIMRCMQRRIIDRYNSVDAILNDLRNVEQELLYTRRPRHRSVHLLTSNFIERKNELDILNGLINDAKQGHGTIVLLGGEKYIGKTRFAEEIKSLAQLRGFLTFSSVCSEKFSYPLQPIVELVQQMLLQMEKRFPEKVSAYAREQDNAAEEELLSSEDPSFLDGKRIISPALRLFIDFACEVPLLLIVDNAQRMDSETARFLIQLSDELSGSNLVMLILYRSDYLNVHLDEDAAHHPIETLLTESHENGPIINLELKRFSRHATERLLRAILNNDSFTPHFLELLFTETEGIPGLIIELLNILASKGILYQDEKGAWKLQEFESQQRFLLPLFEQDYKSVIESISKQEGELVSLLAILSDYSDIDALKTMTKFSAVELNASLLILQKRALVQVLEKKPGKPLYRINHVLLADFVCRLISRETYEKSHRVAFHYYEQRFKKGDKNVVGQLAYHASRTFSDYETLVPMVLSATRHFIEKGAFRDALILFYDIETVILDNYSAILANFNEDILSLPGKLHINLGEYKAALDWFKKILAIYEKDNLERESAIIYQHIARIFIIIGFYDKALRNLHNAIAILANLGESPQLAYAYACLADCYRYHSDIEKTLENSKRSLKIIERYDEIPLASEIYLIQGNILFVTGNFDEAAKYLLRSLKLKELMNDAIGQGNALVALGKTYLAMGKMENATHLFEEAELIFEKNQSLNDIQSLYLALAHMHFRYSGNWEKALRYLRIITSMELSLNNPYNIGFAESETGHIYLQMGNDEKAVNAFEKSFELFSKMNISIGEAETYHSFGLWHLEQGELVQSDEFLQKSLTMYQTAGMELSVQHVQLTLAQLTYKKKDYQLARSMAIELLEYWEGKKLPRERGITLRLLAMISLEIGSIETVSESLTECERIFKRIDSEFELGKTYLEMAKLYFRTSKEKLGNTYTQRAASLFKKIGAQKSAGRLETLIQDMREYALPYLYGIEEKKGELATLYQMSQIITSILDVKDLSERLMDMVMESIKAERGLLILCDPFSKDIHIKIARNFSGTNIDTIDDFSRKVVEEVLTDKKPVLAGDIYGDKKFLSNLSVALFDIRSILCIPLQVREKIIGVLYVDSKDPKNIFTERECNFLAALGNQAAIALDNALLYQQTKSILEGIRDGILTVDQYGNIISINRIAEKILNVTEADVIGKPFPEVFKYKWADKLNTIIKNTIEKKQNFEVELILLPKPELQLNLSVTTSITNDGYGGMTGAIVLLRDVSRIKKIQEELELQRRLSAMGELAAKVAHRMKNLLSGIKILTQGLKRECEAGTTEEEIAQEMLLEVEDAEKYVYQSLNPSKSLGQKALAISFQRVIDTVINQLRPHINEKRIEVLKDITPNLPTLKINEELVTEAIQNLCTNAIDAMEEGGMLHFRLRTTKEPDAYDTDTQEYDEEGIILEVSDTGCGIPPELQDKIFEPFFTTKNKGSGVGLWLVHKLIKSYKGKISIRSQINSGTTFTLFFPTNV